MQGQLALVRLEQCNLIIYTRMGNQQYLLNLTKNCGSNCWEAIEVLWEHMVPELLSRKIDEEVTHA